jgi:hypothetical protein
MEPHSIVVISLQNPKEKLWGELIDITHSGVSVRGIDLGDRMGLPTLFFPMLRIERIALDEPRGSIPSLAELFAKKTGRSLGDYLAQFA